ncbi:unnamed protein product [Microthlaspi erraticum]|uniref:Aberrant root formation protein 4 n=1 Tax=Microthlaspi erraticum TaxID=1685480 RepID=A0A6D2JGJ6_9BRAS|nr:unnamed protein product [Microthlaspi erraticum]
MASPTIRSSESEEVSRRVRELLALCFSSVEAGGSQELEGSVKELVDCLDSLFENVASNSSDELETDDVVQVLAEILKFLSSPQLDQDVIDALSFELPKVIFKFADLSSRCLQLVEEIIDRLVVACNPRDMLSFLCEALDAARCSLLPSSCSTPLLHGLSKVFILVQRRHYEQLKVAVPVVLNVLKDMSLEPDVQVEGVFDKALAIAVSIRDVSLKLKKEEDTKVRCLLGLYVIQITAIFSVRIRDKVASFVPLVVQLEPFLTYCGLTQLGLITGNDTERLMSTVAGGDDDDDFRSSFPDINLGASLLFIWSKISPEVADVANAALRNDVSELQSNPVKRWQAYGMLKYVLSSGDLIWEFKRQTIEFLLDITKGVTPSQCNDEQIDCSDYTPSIYAALQAVTLVMMYAPEAALRIKTFEALKKIVSDIPAPQRFDILRALVTNSQSPSMTAILLGLLKDSMGRLQATDRATADTHVIELVELVLKPPQGGPPHLPDQSDAVIAALNLYRFALIFESTDKERNKVGSEVLSKKNLEKAYKEWLLPLRNVVSCSIAKKLEEDQDQESSLDTECLLVPLESVLYRCIELVEEILESH